METHVCRPQSYWSNVSWMVLLICFQFFDTLRTLDFWVKPVMLKRLQWFSSSAVSLTCLIVLAKKNSCEFIWTSLLYHLIVCWSSVDEMLH